MVFSDFGGFWHVRWFSWFWGFSPIFGFLRFMFFMCSCFYFLCGVCFSSPMILFFMCYDLFLVLMLCEVIFYFLFFIFYFLFFIFYFLFLCFYFLFLCFYFLFFVVAGVDVHRRSVLLCGEIYFLFLWW